jgi:hypothetical protein
MIPHHEIEAMFMACSTQQKAYNTLMAEILCGDLTWCANAIGGGLHEKKITSAQEREMYTLFLKRFVRQVMLFGFCIYRVISSEGRPDIEVGNGVELNILWDKPNHCYRVKTTDKGDWILDVIYEPIRHGDAIVQLTSPAAMAYDASRYVRMYEHNLARRDFLNTSVVFSTQNRADLSLMKIGAGGAQPALSGALNANSTEEFAASAKRNMALVKELSKESRKNRVDTFRRVTTTDNAKEECEIPHVEIELTTGSAYEEIRDKRPQEGYNDNIKALKHSILSKYGIPPSAVGENTNAERLAGSDRIVQLEFSRFMSTLRRFVATIQVPLSRMSSAISKTPACHVWIKPCIGSYSLQQITPILTTGAAVKKYARIFELEEDEICQVRMARFIDGMTEQDDTMAGNAHDSKSGQTDAERKQKNRDNKNKTS